MRIILLLIGMLNVCAEPQIAIRPVANGQVQVFIKSDVPWRVEWSTDLNIWFVVEAGPPMALFQGVHAVSGQPRKGFYRVSEIQ